MKKAFTLIELLVVVAIIGGLSALLFPNFMAARERARDTQRKSDLKQIQKALELYKQDQATPSFPAALPPVDSCWSSLPNCAGTVYMNSVPGDPNRTPANEYYFLPDNPTLTYDLCACLENIADKDGSAGNCSAAYVCASGIRYMLSEP